MNTQFKLRQLASFESNQNGQLLNNSKNEDDQKYILKSHFFGKQDSNININTNNSYGTNDFDQACQAIYSQNSNNNTINFDKYIKMKGKIQNAKMKVDSQNQFGKYAKLNNEQSEINSEQSHTIPVNKKSEKIQMEITEEVTNKFSKKFKQIANQQNKIQKPVQSLQQTSKKKKIKENGVITQNQQNNINIAKNDKVEAILNKGPLRTRYSALLQDHEKYEIGFQHRMLIRLVQVIDNTLDYLKSYRNNKSTFFSNLQANFKKNNGPQLTYQKMKKLLFLEENIYELQWALKDSNNKYDLLIKIPNAQKVQERKKKLRMKIVHYLLAKQVQFLQINNQKKVFTNRWIDGFDPNNYKIPQKQLPIHPLQSQISVKNMSKDAINAIPNTHLRDITADMKKQYEKKCLKSQDVISMIFSKTQKHKFEQELYASIRQKQKMLKQIKPPVQKITKQILISVLIQIQYIYNSKNVTNIFKSTLQEKLLKSLNKYANESIIQSLQIIIDFKDILFLKQQITSNKTVIVQINRSKYEEVKAKIQATY